MLPEIWYPVGQCCFSPFHVATLPMAKTVVAAIDQLLRDSINLDKDVVKTARASRDWLLGQITALPVKDEAFPRLYLDKNLHYGSFARGTKIRALDDIDLIVGVSALGTTYSETGHTVTLRVPDGIALRNLCYDGTNHLNSRKVINAFVGRLTEIPQYKTAEIKRNGSAAVLNLTSYPWNFDIVPGFFTTPEWDGRTYYLIPDGNGQWMKTDPRIDEQRTYSINKRHGGYLWNVMRLTKFWNKRRSVRTMPSYLLECMVLNLYESRLNQASARPEAEIPRVLRHISHTVLTDINDPKGIQGNINTLTRDDRIQISTKASTHAQDAETALNDQARGDERAAIIRWAEVFGTDLPAYG
ncbi:MAG TPA: hypothetical protein VFJ16_12345 [Longimicrobium sp.]|nr:hypothetical protein [Longimicrobium sp.]